MGKYRFYHTCVDWPRYDVEALMKMVDDSITITRATFLKHVDRADLCLEEQVCGYAHHPSRGLTMAADQTVSYHRSKLHGKRVYYFAWSAMEFVFREEDR